MIELNVSKDDLKNLGIYFQKLIKRYKNIHKHIVTRHRGALNIQSVVGKGSIFTITLPQV